MSPKFTTAVDLVFLHVLGLLERIGEGENPSPQDERVRIRSWLDHAEAQLGRAPDWQFAKYALVAWIDEMLIVEAPWKDRDWWNENKLEWEVFQTNDRYQLFYKKAKEAFALPQKDALEMFYVCVVLGFRGLYRDPRGGGDGGRRPAIAPRPAILDEGNLDGNPLRDGPSADLGDEPASDRGPAAARAADARLGLFFGSVLLALLVIVVWLFLFTVRTP